MSTAVRRYGDSDLWLLYLEQPRLAKAYWRNRTYDAGLADTKSYYRMRDCLRPEMPFTRAANLYGA